MPERDTSISDWFSARLSGEQRASLVRYLDREGMLKANKKRDWLRLTAEGAKLGEEIYEEVSAYAMEHGVSGWPGTTVLLDLAEQMYEETGDDREYVMPRLTLLTLFLSDMQEHLRMRRVVAGRMR